MKLISALFALFFATSAQASYVATQAFDTTIEYVLPSAQTINTMRNSLYNFGPASGGGNIIADYTFSLYNGAGLVGQSVFDDKSIATHCTCGTQRFFVPEILVDRVVFEYFGETPAQNAEVGIELSFGRVYVTPLPASSLLLVGGLALVGGIRRFRR